MITCKVSDYMTISILPGEVDIPMGDLLQKALETLYLDELWSKDLFEYKCQSKYYSAIFRFGDIQVKLPYEENYKKTGICFEFSGQGLDYYREYLRLNRVGMDLRKVCARFLALSKLGFKTTSSRFDVAFDEIIKKGELVEPCLDLDRIIETLGRRAFVSKFRKSEGIPASGEIKPFFNELDSSQHFDESLPYRLIASTDLCTGKVGKTIELGKRKGNSFVRFYDKLVEQSAKGFEVPENYASWIRFEIEFKHSNASSVFFQYASSKDDKEFVRKMRGEAYSLIRFVDLDHSRRYNCTVCKWWLDFLDHSAVYVLPYNKPKYNKYIRALAAQKRQNASSLSTLVMCRPQNLKSILLEGAKKSSKTAQAIAADFKAVQYLSPEDFERVYKENTRELTGLEFWQQFCGLKQADKDEFEKFIEDAFESLCSDVLASLGVANVHCASCINEQKRKGERVNLDNL